MAAETRARRRIRKAVESRGYAVESMDWEAIYDAGEKMGLAGGWRVTVDRDYVPNTIPGNELYGLSVEEVLADIDWSLQPAEPCDCDQGDRHRRHPLLPIKGDPERGLHDPECKWHIRYRLRWWKAPGLDQDGEGAGR